LVKGFEEELSTIDVKGPKDLDYVFNFLEFVVF
jgi:hypothetical protein